MWGGRPRPPLLNLTSGALAATGGENKHYLTKDEVKAVMTRRDQIVVLFEELSSEKGEKEVLC